MATLPREFNHPIVAIPEALYDRHVRVVCGHSVADTTVVFQSASDWWLHAPIFTFHM
ncbi:MAG: hypothetical protein ACJ74Z_09015 [Bryobacteraceae bacterium]